MKKKIKRNKVKQVNLALKTSKELKHQNQFPKKVLREKDGKVIHFSYKTPKHEVRRSKNIQKNAYKIFKKNRLYLCK